MLYQVALLTLLKIAMISLLEVVGGFYKPINLAFFPLALWITFSDGTTLNHVKSEARQIICLAQPV